jgi:hypothetical protein
MSTDQVLTVILRARRVRTVTDDARGLTRRGDGKDFDLTPRSASDRAKSWHKNMEYERLQVARDEVSWIERYGRPEKSVAVTLNLSCGAQTVPHVMLLRVGLFERLGVDFVATAGPQFCCGRSFQRYAAIRCPCEGNCAIAAAGLRRVDDACPLTP